MKMMCVAWDGPEYQRREIAAREIQLHRLQVQRMRDDSSTCGVQITVPFSTPLGQTGVFENSCGTQTSPFFSAIGTFLYFYHSEAPKG